jgi:rod shape-determining protein MreC
MAFGASTNRPLPGRGSSPGFRFTLYAFLSILLMFLDQRGGWLEGARFLMQAVAYPAQLAVNSPTSAWRWVTEMFETRDALRAENEVLRKEARELQVRAMRYEALARENGQLRGLKAALPPVAERWLVAEVVNVESLRQRVLINRGTRNGVFKGQAVLDDRGLLGQTTHVGPWSAEVILVTDPEHYVPVQIERTGLRTIAVGAGEEAGLALPFLPANADVEKGDLLITSGLGGVFPQGYPVAKVIDVQRDAVQPLAHVRAAPLAGIDNDREVILVWFRETHPAAPSTAAASGQLAKGDANVVPQPAPPRPPPVDDVATSGTASAASRSGAPSRAAGTAAQTQTSAPMGTAAQSQTASPMSGTPAGGQAAPATGTAVRSQTAAPINGTAAPMSGTPAGGQAAPANGTAVQSQTASPMSGAAPPAPADAEPAAAPDEPSGEPAAPTEEPPQEGRE